MIGNSARGALVGFVLLVCSGTARGYVVYRSLGGCSLGGSVCDPGFLHDENVPPSTSTSGGDISFGGAVCPAPTTPDYACGYLYGQATLDFKGLTMRASCNLRRHDAASGASRLVFAGAEITVYGMTGSVSTPTTGFAKFHFGLGGTFSTTRSNPAVVVHATGYSVLLADTQHFIQCTGTNCGGAIGACEIGFPCAVTIPYSLTPSPGTWSPGYFAVRLRTDVASGATPPDFAGWDAEAFANFEDTLALVAITVEDADHQPVPGAYFTIPDADGMGNAFVVPTEPPATTTSTTIVPGTTTTTIVTLPGTPLPGKKLLLKDKEGNPTKRALVMLAKDAGVGLGAENGTSGDPVQNGGALRVVSTSGDVFDTTYDLPAADWRYQSDEGKNKGYKLKQAGPIRTVLVKLGKKVMVVAKGEALGHSLGADPNPVHVVLALGSQRYCFTFGGQTKFKEAKKYLAKRAPAAACGG